jgi:hypothetical protein
VCFSDSLVEEAFGGETAAKLAFQSDEQGYKESEVALPSIFFILFFSLLYFLRIVELGF